MIEGLPRDSAYVDAVSGDEVLAERLLEHEDPPPARPRVREWSPVVELLSSLLDRVSELIQVTAAAAGGQPRNVDPAPRPVTALQKVRERRRNMRHRALAAKLLPHTVADQPPE